MGGATCMQSTTLTSDSVSFATFPRVSCPLLARVATPQRQKSWHQSSTVAMQERNEACSIAGSNVGPLEAVAQLKRRREEGKSERNARLKEWLGSLDDGAGCMLQYYDILVTEFDADLAQIAAVKCDNSSGQGLLSLVDPIFWEIVKVHKMGHRMLFAH